MRTAEEIKRQVDGLTAMKSTLPEFSAFGDPNWEAIDAQIEVLEGRKTLDDFNENAEHEHVYSQVMDADGWLSGHIDEDLFDE